MSTLSPRRVPAEDEAGPNPLRKRRRVVIAVVVVLVVAGGFIAYQGLRNATLFFRNVDEAVEAQAELGDRRFRLQGRVVEGSVAVDAGVTTFEVVHNCVVAQVRHTTDPPELFRSPWIPVVLEGHWAAGSTGTGTAGDGGGTANAAGDAVAYFASDRMLVKHTNEYAADNAERIEPEPATNPLAGCDRST